ncbi:hypothetical protein DMENIID0001_039620 [Sergentomyia squamirostris]
MDYRNRIQESFQEFQKSKYLCNSENNSNSGKPAPCRSGNTSGKPEVATFVHSVKDKDQEKIQKGKLLPSCDKYSDIDEEFEKIYRKIDEMEVKSVASSTETIRPANVNFKKPWKSGEAMEKLLKVKEEVNQRMKMMKSTEMSIQKDLEGLEKPPVEVPELPSTEEPSTSRTTRTFTCDEEDQEYSKLVHCKHIVDELFNEKLVKISKRENCLNSVGGDGDARINTHAEGIKIQRMAIIEDIFKLSQRLKELENIDK